MQSDQTLGGGEEGVPQRFWRGFQIGCYNCHAGPDGEGFARNRLPTVTDVSASTKAEQSVPIPLTASDVDADALALQIVAQPSHGNASLSGNVATYFPDPGFIGTDSFTFAAWDGSTDSNLGQATVVVSPGAPRPPSPVFPTPIPSDRLRRMQSGQWANRSAIALP